MLLARLVDAAARVAATPSRTAKVRALAELLREAGEEAPLAVGLLSGDPRQGRVGVGWAAIAKVAPAPASEPSLAVRDLDAMLDAIPATTGRGAAERRTSLIEGLLARATAPEQDFVRRLLVGELRQGALEGVMTDAIAHAAGVANDLVRRAAMLSGDLAATAALALDGGEEALRGVGLQLLRPVQPMLASSSSSVEEAVATAGEASVEWKLDGIRIQVHRAGSEVRIFTRNLNDITERLPQVADVARAFPADRFVLDGEAISVAPGERPAPFQDTMSRVGRGGGEEVVVPFFFDVLHLGGADLIDRPLHERAAALDELVGRYRMPRAVTADARTAGRVLREALDAGHEGVVVKALGSPYQAGRRGKAWLKVKPVRTLDLVVLGAEWGSGRRRGWLSNLHLGAREEATGGFVMVGKTFKGLTDELLRWQTERLLALERERRGVAVLVQPELVVEIALDGVQRSARYAGGVALRFARVVRYREDKDPRDADTIETVRAMLPG